MWSPTVGESQVHVVAACSPTRARSARAPQSSPIFSLASIVRTSSGCAKHIKKYQQVRCDIGKEIGKEGLDKLRTKGFDMQGNQRALVGNCAREWMGE